MGRHLAKTVFATSPSGKCGCFSPNTGWNQGGRGGAQAGGGQISIKPRALCPPNPHSSTRHSHRNHRPPINSCLQHNEILNTASKASNSLRKITDNSERGRLHLFLSPGETRGWLRAAQRLRSSELCYKGEREADWMDYTRQAFLLWEKHFKHTTVCGVLVVIKGISVSLVTPELLAFSSSTCWRAPCGLYSHSSLTHCRFLRTDRHTHPCTHTHL